MNVNLLVCHVDILVIAIAFSLVSTLSIQYKYGGDTEIWSELLCWITLVVGVELFTRCFDEERGQGKEKEKHFHCSTLVVAAGVAVGSFCRSVDDVRWISPLLYPILSVFREYHATDIGGQPNPWRSPCHAHSLWSRGAIALASALALVPLATINGVIIAFVSLLAQTAIYLPLIQITDPGPNLSVPVATLRQLRNISHPTAAILFFFLCARLWLGSRPETTVFPVIYAGVYKAVNWVLLFYIVNRVPWDFATTSSTFAIACSIDSFSAISVIRALSRSATALAALTQSVFLVPRLTKARCLLFAFGICSLLPLLRIDVTVRGTEILAENIGIRRQPQHPIEILIQRSNDEFHAMLERQSSNLHAAIANYQTRYGRVPPPGFDKWFAYAKLHGSPIIDDFDSIIESLEPFWQASPAVLRKNIEEVLKLPNPRLWALAVKDGNPQQLTQGGKPGEIQRMLGDVFKDLPDVTLVFNDLDEPRVILPKDPVSGTLESHSIEFHNGSARNTWSAFTQPCSRQALAQPIKGSIYTYGLPFLANTQCTKDICLHPEYEQIHGIFMSPETFLYTDAHVPILSPAKLSTNADILLPAPSYVKREADYNESNDHDWENKTNMLYWVGSTSGSHRTNSSWHTHHRQRFVTLVNQLQNITHTFLTETRPGVWQTWTSREILSQLYKVKFTRLLQCDEPGCLAEQEFFRFGKLEHANEAFRYRFLFDLDGNSFSGRFYGFLASHSVVLKQTLFREWHDERLFPWVHYVPVSLGLRELPEVMRYLALTESGAKRAKEIAEGGRMWKLRALRTVDMGVYLYRLVLEYARLMDDTRDDAYITFKR